MKNSFFTLFILLMFNNLFAEDIFIESKNISIDKNKELSIFKEDVIVKTDKNNTIKSDYAEYDRLNGYLKFENNIQASDEKNNIIETNYAEYFDIDKVFKSKGLTKIVTSEKYVIETEDILLNNITNIVSSNKPTTIRDKDNNVIYLENFEYSKLDNIFKSIGYIQIEDSQGNKSEFSQIYIDTKKKEILGTDIKVFLNQEDFKVSENNKPRIFSNTMKINEGLKSFNKSIFTLCDYRKNDKCPPWTIQASEMLHDHKKKTIYYDNAVIKVYDIPIFYFPKLSHPDPTVNRRSGFLPPSFSDTKNLGAGFTVPYYWAVDKDKDFTITNKFFADENPLFLGEYRQAFKNSNLILDAGYTEGYKKISSSKKGGDKSHLFLEFINVFTGKNNSENTFTFKSQNVSNDKYLKLYKIDSSLVDYNLDTIESSLSFTHEDEDLFLGFNTSVYETLKDSSNDKYEYILPEITLGKNILNNDLFGNVDLQSNIKVHNYDTNKTSRVLVNDFDWDIKEHNFENGLNSKLIGKIKNVNYDSKNIDNFKDTKTNEFFGAIGFLSELNLFKQKDDLSKQILTPKMLLRYAPGKMRKETDGSRLTAENIFSLDRLNLPNNFENGLSATVGFDYEIDKKDNSLKLSAGQIFNETHNKNMPSKTSLNRKTSDFVGSSNLKIKNDLELNYNFSMDENLKDFNYNELSSKVNLNKINFNFKYLQEKEHIGDQEYFTSKINFLNKNNTEISFENKRNLITNSSEFYNLSYEYLNDCLRAGLVYRREFYNDSELEPENSLMFKITLIPFGNIDSPTFDR